MVDINCKTEGCDEFVTTEEEVVAVTCSTCCATIGTTYDVVS